MGDTLNGELGYVFLVSILDAAILSWIALRWYRRSVLRFMQGPAAAAAPDAPANASALSADALPRLLDLESGAAPAPVGATALPPVWRRVAAACLAGALAYSIVVTTAMTLEIWPIPAVAVATFLWVNMWPVVPALVVLLALRWPQALKLVVLFVVSGSVVVALLTFMAHAARGAFDSAPFTNMYVANHALVQTAYAPLALLLIISWRRIRAVFAVTLAATLLFGIALLAFRRAVIEMLNVGLLKSALLTLAAATSSQVAYYALYMLLALPVGLLVWKVLRWLAAAFDRKAFSDVQLVADCWFAIVTMEVIATHLVQPFGLAGVAIGVSAFAAYRAGVEIVLRAWPASAGENGDGRAGRLLLLRVFGHQSRTERLFDHIAQRWRFRGPVQLIAGGDLAMRTVDPGDVLAFVSGRLRNQYVASAAEIPARVERLDMRRDPDGRFRINELYCLHDTWQGTLQALLAVTDAVVMDLRGFSTANRGVLYELQQIVARIPTDRIVFITERGIDTPLLEGTLALAWVAAADTRPPLAAHPIAVVQVDRNAPRELDAVMSRLLGIFAVSSEFPVAGKQ